MGIYINPIDMTKEDWLILHGTIIPQKDAREFQWNKKTFVVCLINNGGFTAAGVMFSKKELAYFLDTFREGSSDLRPTSWFTAEKVDLDIVLNNPGWDRDRSVPEKVDP